MHGWDARVEREFDAVAETVRRQNARMTSAAGRKRRLPASADQNDSATQDELIA